MLMRDALGILLTVLVAVKSLLGGGGGTSVLCLGGGHRHGSAEVEHGEPVCTHDSAWPVPRHGDDHDRDCGCIDAELTVAELVTLPRGDDGGKGPPAVVRSAAWGVVVLDSGLGRRGPPVPPAWFDPGGAHRLVILASVVLTV
jgi:hypothetical protein